MAGLDFTGAKPVAEIPTLVKLQAMAGSGGGVAYVDGFPGVVSGHDFENHEIVAPYFAHSRTPCLPKHRKVSHLILVGWTVTLRSVV